MGIARVSKKPNTAMAADNGAALKAPMASQNRVQRDLILTNKRVSAVVSVPILRKDKNLLEGYDEKARLSVMMMWSVFTPSSYLLDVKASRGKTGIFYGLAFIASTIQTFQFLPLKAINRLSIRSLKATWKKETQPNTPFFSK